MPSQFSAEHQIVKPSISTIVRLKRTQNEANRLLNTDNIDIILTFS